MKKLSIVIPVYYNEDNLISLYEDMEKNIFRNLVEMNYTYELIFVDDGSDDNSFLVMEELRKKDKNIVNIQLSRNFGSHSAILAGLSIVSGDCVVTKAADLQEPSKLVIEMLKEYELGFNVVLAVRADREEGFFQKGFAEFYYTLMRKFAFKNMPKGGFDCFLADKKVVDVLNAMEEKNTTIMGQVLWSGFKTKEVYYKRLERKIGKSKWTLSKKIKLVVDSLLSFSYFPLRFIAGMGFCLFMISILWSLIIFINKLIGNINVSGFTTLSIILIGGFGLVMLSLGIIGEYMWRMFDATRKRPPFIIENLKQTKVHL